jgi:hypothetical protein
MKLFNWLNTLSQQLDRRGGQRRSKSGPRFQSASRPLEITTGTVGAAIQGLEDRTLLSFDSVFELSSLNGANGFKMSGVAANDHTGGSVSDAGDINGDGIADVIVGARFADPHGSNSGASYVVFGKATAFDANLDLSTLDGTNGFKISGVAADDVSGHSVSGAGDINGDGIDDLIVGADYADANATNSGACYVVFGSRAAFNANLDLSALNGTNGFKISGELAGDAFGTVSGAGDINGDGIDDLIVSAPAADPNGSLSGASYVVFGSRTPFAANLNVSSLTGSNGFKISGAAAGDYFGQSVSGAGDINSDGIDDLIVGAFFGDANGTDAGASYVFFGKTTAFAANLDLSSLNALLNGTNGLRIIGAAAYDQSGLSVSGAGDINGDGIDDLIVDARGADANGADSGASYVVFGKTTGFAENLNLSALTGTNGFKISGVAVHDLAGQSVSGAGDINGDGIDDLIVGAFYSGASYVVFGSRTAFAENLNLSALTGTNGFKINGVTAGDYAGRSVSGAGDINGDGHDDLIVGATHADPNGSNSGASYIVFGHMAPNVAPTDIALSNNAVLENLASGTAVGTFSTSDLNEGNAFTYTLVSGTGSNDNASFTITGATLKTAAVFNFEVNSSYSVRIRSTDQGGLTFDKQFTINVTNVNETPTDIGSNLALPVELVSKANPALLNDAMGGYVQNGALSANGRYLVFQSDAAYLVPGDTNWTTDVFRLDRLTGDIVLVSVNSAGTGSANSQSTSPVISSDGTVVAFMSYASNLAANDNNNNNRDVFVRNLSSGTTTLVSINSAGNGSGNSESSSPVISSDGTVVAFQSFAGNLAANDNNNNRDVFVRNLSSGTTTLVSINSAGNGSGNGNSNSPVISSDGTVVAFYSDASNLAANDNNGNYDVFARNLSSGTTTLVSVNSAGTGSGNGNSNSPVISSDGTVVAFLSGASDLAANDNNNNNNNNNQDVFARNLSSGTTTLVSVNSAGTGSGNNQSYNAVISNDGTVVAFMSYASNLSANDNNGTQDVFARNLSSGMTTLVSVNSTGNGSGNSQSYGPVVSSDGTVVAFLSFASDLAANDNNGTADVFTSTLSGPPTLASRRAATIPASQSAGGDSGSVSISANGRYLAFESSAGNLVPGDTNGTTDVFRLDRLTGDIVLVSVNSAGTGSGNSYSSNPVISSDGTVVAFFSYARDLAANDTDNNKTLGLFARNLLSGTTALVAASFPQRDPLFNQVLSSDGTVVAFQINYDVFARNLSSGTTTLVSVNSAGTGSGNGASFSPVISSDGTVVAFLSGASDLAGNDNNNHYDVFARNLSSGTTTLVSVNSAGTGSGNSQSTSPVISSDGTVVAFMSYASNLSANDNNGTQDVFARNLSSGMTTLVSMNSAGTGSGNIESFSPVISSDGTVVAFTSYASDLAANDTNGYSSDVFARNLSSGTTTLVSVNSAGTGSGNNQSYSPVISNDGTVVAFTSGASDLAANDTNGLPDVFVTKLSGNLSSDSLAENNAANATIGTLSATDPDVGATFTFSLATGTGDTDNASFSIVGNTLKITPSANFEAKSSYSILVRVTDQDGLTFDKPFTITITNVNEAPTDIALSLASIAENNAANATVGTLSASDPDASSTFTYALVSGTGSTDNQSFTIVGNTLQTNAVFDFEMKSSYAIRVRTTDQDGLAFEKEFTITVTDVQEDVTKPVSLITALPAASTMVSFTVAVTGSDPGAGASGVKEYDLYYSTGGAFIKFATVLAGSPSTTFTGSANTTYWFRSLARDNAGNVEAKTTSDTYTRIGDVVPPVTQVTSAPSNSNGVFTIQMTGTKASGSALTQFDVYVSVDSSAAVLIGTASGGVATNGVYSASIVFQGLLDGNSHTYRFYSIGRDGAGNVEALPANGDVLVTVLFNSQPFSATGIDVQNGANQRSYIRYLDVLFSSAAGLTAWSTTGRVSVERFGIDATNVAAGTGTVVATPVFAKDGNKLKLDFGATGLGGLNLAGNGFYRVRLDINGDGDFLDAEDKAYEFYRLFGDANGDRKVDIADTNLVISQVGRTGLNLDGDLDGNGAVNSTDRLYSVQQRGKKLLDPLLGWLDD